MFFSNVRVASRDDVSRHICRVADGSEWIRRVSPSSAPLFRQYHPLSLCNTSEDERQESDFITIVKLEQRVPRCLPLLDKVPPHTHSAPPPAPTLMWRQLSCHLVSVQHLFRCSDLDFKVEEILWPELGVLSRRAILQSEGLDRGEGGLSPASGPEPWLWM